jgi:hypothetical protein
LYVGAFAGARRMTYSTGILARDPADRNDLPYAPWTLPVLAFGDVHEPFLRCYRHI